MTRQDFTELILELDSLERMKYICKFFRIETTTNTFSSDEEHIHYIRIYLKGEHFLYTSKSLYTNQRHEKFIEDRFRSSLNGNFNMGLYNIELTRSQILTEKWDFDENYWMIKSNQKIVNPSKDEMLLLLDIALSEVIESITNDLDELKRKQVDYVNSDTKMYNSRGKIVGSKFGF